MRNLLSISLLEQLNQSLSSHLCFLDLRKGLLGQVLAPWEIWRSQMVLTQLQQYKDDCGKDRMAVYEEMSRHSQCTDRTAERYINFSLMLVSNFFYSSDCKSLGGMLVG